VTKTMIEYTLLEEGMILHIRKPIILPAQGVSILLHGWTGDENAMNAFWDYMPENDWLLAPRAPQTANPAGYAWAQITPNMFPNYEALLPSVEQLLVVIKKFMNEQALPHLPLKLIGFSQGAAVAYMLAALIPDQISQVISIAGFLPEGTLNNLSENPIRSTKIAIFHGANDKLVPVKMATQTESDLKTLGYEVSLCVDPNTGHKLGPSCVKFLQELAR